MKHHEIDLEGLQSWYDENEVMFAMSTAERKKLMCSMRGTFRIYVNDKLVWQGMQPFSAVEKYNSIRRY